MYDFSVVSIVLIASMILLTKEKQLLEWMYSLCRLVFCLSQTIIRNTKFLNWLFLGFGNILVLLIF